MADEWDIVQVLESEEDAELVAGFLESRGVRCEVESSHSNEFPVTVGTLGVVRLKVPVEQADEARRLLAERDAGAGELPEGALMDETAASPPEGESR